MATSAIRTYSGVGVVPLTRPDKSRRAVVNLKISTTFAAGTLLGEITGSPGVYGPYASGNSDGTQNPVGVLQYPCVTDSSGNITFGTTGGGGEWGQTEKGAPLWLDGLFSCAELVGLDANAVTKLGRLVEGSTSAGQMLITG